MLPNAVVTNSHTEHSTTAANEPGVPPEKWQQKRIVRQKEKLRSNLLKSGFQFIDRFVELLKEMEDVPKDTKKKYLQKGLHERRIMIELSSIKTWHKAMAYAVHHGNTGLAITFPEGVWSQAFQFNVEEQKYQEKSPCGKCQQMFRNVNFCPPPDTPATGDKWQYGNCAEVESLSKLLLGTRVVEEGVQSTRTPPLPNSYEAIERDFTTSIEEDIKKSLIKRLRSRQFKAKTLQFFNLQ
ncbi:hypothetical protein UY3_10405 [Chelonia mydas]|uniref:Uncharacterized protein n=1 Tax=Chelonia mydas TaxID=8469 RepID=M7B3I2_CHEMY|nr:hypothetical protein UY3_10405 [Chelonia mydas]